MSLRNRFLPSSPKVGDRWPDLLAIGIVLFITVFRLFFIRWNRAEFTDSIMQLTLFENGNGYFPPLFTILTRLFIPIAGEGVIAGRIVSILSSGVSGWVLYRIGKRWMDCVTGLFALALFSVLPIPWRWSLHAMGDALFVPLFLAALFPLFEERDGVIGERFPEQMLLFGGLSTLVRYQGLLFLPLAGVLLVGHFLLHRKEMLPKRMFFLIPWIFVALWMGLWGMEHAGQFAERTRESGLETLRIYFHFAFRFILYSPYAFGTVFLFLFAGGFLWALWDRRTRWLSITLLLLFGIWLSIHSAFQSFQYRYFLPLVPLFCLFAARGLRKIGERVRMTWFSLLLLLCCGLESGWLTVRVLQGTRNTFADVKEAAESIGKYAPEGYRLYSNSSYNPRYAYPVKMRYWSGREDIFLANLLPIPGGARLVFAQGQEPSGPFVFAWHNVYSPAGMDESAVRRFLEKSGGRVLERIEYENVPFLPDIMVTPGNITSWPLAMEYRDVPQKYVTLLIEIPGGIGSRTGFGEIPGQTR